MSVEVRGLVLKGFWADVEGFDLLGVFKEEDTSKGVELINIYNYYWTSFNI